MITYTILTFWTNIIHLLFVSIFFCCFYFRNDCSTTSGYLNIPPWIGAVEEEPPCRIREVIKKRVLFGRLRMSSFFSATTVVLKYFSSITTWHCEPGPGWRLSPAPRKFGPEPGRSWNRAVAKPGLKLKLLFMVLLMPLCSWYQVCSMMMTRTKTTMPMTKL